MNKDKINGYGAILRFVTPILIGLVAYLGKMAVDDIKGGLTKLDTHFTNHLSSYQKNCIVVESRLSRIEALLEK